MLLLSFSWNGQIWKLLFCFHFHLKTVIWAQAVQKRLTMESFFKNSGFRHYCTSFLKEHLFLTAPLINNNNNNFQSTIVLNLIEIRRKKLYWSSPRLQLVLTQGHLLKHFIKFTMPFHFYCESTWIRRPDMNTVTSMW